jgi:hypothetical protein
MKIFLTLFTVLILGFSVFGQEETKDLTNDSIIEMAQAKIPDSVIISKIKVSKVKFQTEIADIKLLTEKGVSESVILVMIEKSAEKQPEVKPVEGTWENPEYGNISEINESTKVFVLSENSEARNFIINELSKYPRLQIVGRMEDADFMLVFAMAAQNTGASIIGSSVSRNTVVVGELGVVTRGRIENNKRHQRILWTAKKVQNWSGGLTLSRHPAVNAVRDFIKDLKKSRKEK